MNWNTLIRYGLAGLTEGARILRYIFITALLFTLYPIGASFGHLPVGDHIIVWQALLSLTVITGIIIGFWRGFSTGWFINMVGLIIIALTGLNPTFRLLGPSVSALYVLVSMLLIGGAASTGTIFGYGIAPGEATITNAPSGEVFGIVMLVTFWLVLTVLGVGIATPLTEPLYIVGILGIALVVIPGSLYLGIGKTATRWVFGITSALLIVTVAAAILDSMHTLKVIPQSPAKALWKSATQSLEDAIMACEKKAATAPFGKEYKGLKEIHKWRARNTAITDATLDLYTKNEAAWRLALEQADPDYKRCVDAVRTPASAGGRLSPLGWLNIILYEWPWWATMLIAPLVVVCIFGAVFLGGSPSDKAVDRALKFWALWIVLVFFLRIM